VWFEQVEGSFALSNITQDSTKFYYVISQLDNKYAAEVDDVMTNPSPTGRYGRIKAELITRLSLPEEQRVCQLLMHEKTGDRLSSSATSGLWPAGQYLLIISALCGQITCRQTFRP
jgi:hypothetical protein